MPTQTSLLTREQKQQFHEDGYCIVPNLFSEEEITEIENFFEDFKRKDHQIYDDGKGAQGGFDETDRTKQQIRALQPHRHHPKPRDWMLHPPVAAVLEELLGRPALGVQTMYYFKPPGGKGQGMHQDNIYLLAKPHTCIAAWTAIDSADEENGCLYVVPGSHRDHIICPEKDGPTKTWLNYGDTHITRFPREQKPVPIPVPRGATMFFGGNLIHGSGPNRTRDRYRRSFIGHYIDDISTQVAKFYHPVLNMNGEILSNITLPIGGGPCGDGNEGAVH